jgi:hypothetical protein
MGCNCGGGSKFTAPIPATPVRPYAAVTSPGSGAPGFVQATNPNPAPANAVVQPQNPVAYAAATPVRTPI